MPPAGATALITHRVRDGAHAAYGDWLGRIHAACSRHPGHLDTQFVRPIAGLTDTYTVIVRFSSTDHLKDWLGSDTRQQLIVEVGPLLATADTVQLRSGLDFWFQSPAAPTPKRWKQALATWLVLYPLVLGVPLLLLPALHALGVPSWRWLDTLWATVTIVCLMVWLVMPRWTRMLQRWLYR